MRIAQVVVTDQFAGVERYVSSTSNELAVRGHSVIVVGGHSTRMRNELRSDVVWRRGESAGVAARSVLGLGRVDLVHAHMTSAELVAAATQISTHGRLVATRHIASPRGSTLVRRRVAAFAQLRFDCEIAVSDYVASQLEHKPDVVLLPGVPTCDQPYAADATTVLAVQRLEAEKRTDEAIRIWAQSGLSECGWRLRIVGNGSLHADLLSLARQVGVFDTVDFAGWSDDVRSELGRAVMLLATTATEAFGLSVVEAMAAGVPVVAVASGGHAETVGAVDGAALYAPGDVDAGATLLRELAGDPARRLAISDAQRSRQRSELTVTAHARSLEAVYVAVLSGRRSASRSRRR